MNTFFSINPYTLTPVAEYQLNSQAQVAQKIKNAETAFSAWSKLSIRQRCEYFAKLIAELRKNKRTNAELITQEMGKTITEAEAEIEKCIVTAEFYIAQAEKFLAPQPFESAFGLSFLAYEPVGAVFGIMPWNFPFWQALRYILPTLLAGNVTLLKHAPNVCGSALALEKMFLEAGFPEGVMQVLIIETEQCEAVIAAPIVQGVTLTGSERAGSAVAALAGKYLKKSVLELGGSDPFLVLEDANIEKAVEVGLFSRLANAGQSCIGAKRWLLAETIADDFLHLLTQKIQAYKLADPLLPDTKMAVMARPDLVDTLARQVELSRKAGAQLLVGGERENNYFAPTILSEVAKGMPAFDQELFGPVIAIKTFKTESEGLELANMTELGLGASIWTQDREKAMRYARQIQAGTVALNALVRSDAKMPFGGTKKSGYGRELSDLGMREFTNIKTIYGD